MKYLIVKNTNNEAINTPTANAKKNKTVDGVLPTNEDRAENVESPESLSDIALELLVDEEVVAVSWEVV